MEDMSVVMSKRPRNDDGVGNNQQNHHDRAVVGGDMKRHMRWKGQKRPSEPLCGCMGLKLDGSVVKVKVTTECKEKIQAVRSNSERRDINRTMLMLKAECLLHKIDTDAVRVVLLDRLARFERGNGQVVRTNHGEARKGQWGRFRFREHSFSWHRDSRFRSLIVFLGTLCDI
jgi:hypothetical protein